MSDEQKNVELPQETQPVTTADVPAEIKPLEVVPVTEAPVVIADAETAPAAAATTEATEAEATPAVAEEAKKEEEEVKPVEEGHLEHKGQPANFPKNLLFSKRFFWFGSEPVDLKSISTFKADKAADVAHHVTAWAAETGKGLLFFSEKADKAAPHGAIHLADASEPATDGPTKFHFTAKGHKHAFKASNTAERDNWVNQLKAKIAEAKELANTVVESETYKKTIETLNPAAVKKEEKAPEAAAAVEPATEATAEGPTTEETPAATEEVATTEPIVKEEAKKEDAKEEGSKRRSASRKRTSIFGNLGFGKKEEKKPVTVEAEKKEEAAETPVRPTPAKRTSLFGNLSFGKKKAASPAPVAADEAPAATTEPVAETAPVIPAVDTTEPLSAEVNSPATVPTETVEVPAATSGAESPKKEVKTDKRKSSLPFAFGKKEKATSDEEIEKPKSPSPFSRLRDTIKGKGKGKTEKSEKAEEKTEEVPAIPETEVEAEAAKEEAAPATTTTEEAVKPATETEAAPAVPATEEAEAEKPASSVPVTAAA
ncbi:hypothetical protein SMACR_00211 [Sordaria macrospora]|uniref:WGS project CABT00000000 data, contig 2.1 n=2 Tax=Sordaria macrospora TaxID=5147 RepID=F7VKG8_SORMK|nr:uncharacterized protein SMAC_00211 [Sordaria macrospora k-hell]KAA8636784.1 hypothetical protein SMACR_00211 [Sordaria macrospora]CCC05995.1 unnamed protein product [Sordaria macrospora k-hell]